MQKKATMRAGVGESLGEGALEIEIRVRDEGVD